MTKIINFIATTLAWAGIFGVCLFALVAFGG